MNKLELIKRLSAKMSITQVQSTQFMNTLEELITDELHAEGTVFLQGFGAFKLWEQSTRAARNPRTGTPCVILPRTSVKFKPGKRLLKVLNNA